MGHEFLPIHQLVVRRIRDRRAHWCSAGNIGCGKPALAWRYVGDVRGHAVLPGWPQKQKLPRLSACRNVYVDGRSSRAIRDEGRPAFLPSAEIVLRDHRLGR